MGAPRHGRRGPVGRVEVAGDLELVARVDHAAGHGDKALGELRAALTDTL